MLYCMEGEKTQSQGPFFEFLTLLSEHQLLVNFSFFFFFFREISFALTQTNIIFRK